MKMYDEFVKDFEEAFEGWDFSFVTETGRIQSHALTWSYGSLVLPYIKTSSSMLDMGTGGGELLSKFRPLPAKVTATEAYEPNIPIARERLEPLGIHVAAISEDSKLPFEDEEFDLIINKHESFSPYEVRRILKPEGTFITQQVGGYDCRQINEALGSPENVYENWDLEAAVHGLEQHGFTITKAVEEFPVQRFYDIGALLYYLKAIPWQVPDFTIEGYDEPLKKIHQQIQEKGYFDAKQHRFLIEAHV
ncbi:class I SAM-dependent methyltransferase [Halobacillus litoralis]|uniref:class I SAM-dependent methyltransferase n=1 Tax=Halobacillus litoralis TaxID=45668 RepID=UPI001CD7F34F|nr:class I SAM-dependent methyltransferase [Halobacillus litoralis]MCA0972411.1 class I SAM-dependent methyltransferase [Halobacillus litoralis]